MRRGREMKNTICINPEANKVLDGLSSELNISKEKALEIAIMEIGHCVLSTPAKFMLITETDWNTLYRASKIES